MTAFRVPSARVLAFSALFAAAVSTASANDTGAAPAGLTAPTTAAAVAAAANESQGALYAIPTTADHAGRILARVMVNGQGPFRFMVDTGANQTVLAASLLQRLHLSSDSNSHVQVSGIAGSALASTVYVESLDAGALKLHAARLPVLAGPVLADIDGILGIDSLENRTLNADFIHDRLAIYGTIGGVPMGDTVIPARLVSRNLLEIDGLVGGVRVKAVVDTGSPRTLGNEALLQALRHRFQVEAHGAPTAVVDATETSQAGSLQLVPSLRFGNAMIANLYVTFGDFAVFHRWDLGDQPALLLGMDVLGGFAEMSIDYRRRELGLLAKPDAPLPVPR